MITTMFRNWNYNHKERFLMKKFLPAAIMAAAVWSPVMAADLPKALPIKAIQPYDMSKCGPYVGVNTIGSAGGVNATNGVAVAPGTQVVQGGIGGTFGYGCPIGAATSSGQSFWFIEGMADVTNVNGNANGISLSGPAAFTERFGVGTPINNLLGLILPAGNAGNPAVPNLPVLPSGITAGAGNPYFFFALHQTDISASLGLANGREWQFSYGGGLGNRYRLSNGVVADTWAEYQAAPTSNSLCVGPAGSTACARFGSKAMVGVALLY
jgi:opacity protein-like surface antigen